MVSRKVYTPSLDCPSSVCATNNSKGRVIPNFAVSKFVPFQELKVQETSDQTPEGSIPRTFTVQCRGGLTRQCVPGDIIRLCGIFMPKVNDSQVMGTRDILVQDTYIEAMKIDQEKKRFGDHSIDTESFEKLIAEASSEPILSKLAASLSPEIFGLEHVKKALLLQLVGGSTLKAEDGMRIRGDINIALIGDPGVAKSQLLKAIAHITPRGVYTSGKGSSGAGLTAAVMRDPLTGEVVLEGGALVLADMGVCCIDEFDKMDEKDRTSIHEVMEQQTVSIAKAGITTTLNARTSILAAANPVFGRYNRARTPHENVGLPPSLLSRFDLLFLLLDRPDEAMDARLAAHVTHVHQTRTHPEKSTSLFDSDSLRALIGHAKTFNPTLGYDLHAHLIHKYVDKRQKGEKESAKTTYGYTTPRTLLAVVRLSQALAKLRFSNEVSREDVEEALNLMEESQRSVSDSGEVSSYRANARKDPVSQIYQMLVAECSKNQDRTVSKADFEAKVIQKGLSVADCNKCLENYASLDVLLIDDARDSITLLQANN